MENERPPEEKKAGTVVEKVREKDKIMLILSYLGLLALVPLLTVKDSKFVVWRAKNGLVLGVGGSVVAGLMQGIPFMNFLGSLLMVAVWTVDVIAMLKALKGESWRIPGVSEVAERF